jgi:II/X family phage/plasmid replication protein
MSAYAFQQFQIQPRAHATDWTVSRIDVTGNLLLDSLEDVREALRILRDVEGGRYRVSQQAGDTVYWSHRSRLRSGKAYAKGPHLDYQMRKNREYGGREYQVSDVQLANRLLRLELSLRSQLLREDRLGKAWHELTSGDLYEQWNDYFGRMIGDSEMMKDADLKRKVIEAAPTEGQGKAAYGCWTLIKSEGWERAKDMCTKRTWYRNLKILRAAGLGDVDFSAGRVVEFRRRILDAKLIESWDELKRVA